MENNFWKTFAIILIAILVVGAVIVFWRNPELSPNAGVIKVQQSKYGPEVYTKAEVDAKLNGINSGVLGMLNKCYPILAHPDFGYFNKTLSCNQICKNGGSICTSGLGIVSTNNQWEGDNWNTDSLFTTQIIPCDVAWLIISEDTTLSNFMGERDQYLNCLCCSP